MDNSKFCNDAIDLVQKAIAADDKGDFAQALPLYRDALSRFAMAIKYEPNTRRKELLTQRAEDYMERAEQLKKNMTSTTGTGTAADNKIGGESSNTTSSSSTSSSPSKNDSSSSKDGGGGGDGGNGDKPEEDPETKKIRGALASVIVSEKPNVKWEDVIGLEGAKESLKETVLMPVLFPQLFVGERKPFKGILLFGPPGTGKSLLAKAVATESDSVFFSVSSADLISKWQGESEKLVRNLFEMARESEGTRAIIFVDEVDSLCGSRTEGESDSLRRVKTEFLVQMDGVGKGGPEGSILILGATNVPWSIDSAIRRRFEKRVYLPLPENHARSYMIKLHLGDTPNNLVEADFDKLGELLEGASGSDIEVMVKEALMEPVRRCQRAKQFRVVDGKYYPCEKYPSCCYCPPKLSTDAPGLDYTCGNCGSLRMTLWEVEPEKLDAPPVELRDFQTVMTHSHSTVSEEELKKFQEWTTMFGQDGA